MGEQTKVETRIARLRYAGGEAFVAETQSGHALVTSFAHEARSAASPMELLLVALGGCTGADVVSILERWTHGAPSAPNRVTPNVSCVDSAPGSFEQRAASGKQRLHARSK